MSGPNVRRPRGDSAAARRALDIEVASAYSVGPPKIYDPVSNAEAAARCVRAMYGVPGVDPFAMDHPKPKPPPGVNGVIHPNTRKALNASRS